MVFASALFACSTDTGSTSETLTRLPGVCGSVETHIVGVYEAPNNDATIILLRPGKHALVVSAHEATTWHVKLGPGAELVHVYAVGYHAQTVDAPIGPDVVTESFDQDGVAACGFAWSNDTSSGCDTNQLVALAGHRVHHTPTSFHGCYRAANWTIGSDLAVTSDCDAGYEQADKITDCGTHPDGTCGGGSGSGSGGEGSGSGSGIIIP